MKLGQKLLVSIGTMFIFQKQVLKMNSREAATPADKKLIYMNNPA